MKKNWACAFYDAVPRGAIKRRDHTYDSSVQYGISFHFDNLSRICLFF